MTSLFDSRTKVVVNPPQLGDPRVRIISSSPQTLNQILTLLQTPAFVQASISVDVIDDHTLVVEMNHFPFVQDISFEIAFAAALIGTKGGLISFESSPAEIFHLWELWVDTDSFPILDRFEPYFTAYLYLANQGK